MDPEEHTTDGETARIGAPAVPEHIVAKHLADEPSGVAAENSTEAAVTAAEPAHASAAPEASTTLKPPAEASQRRTVFQKFGGWVQGHKRLSYPLIALVLLAIVFGVPFTRYKVLGLALKQSFSVTVLDETTKKPVTNANVTLAGTTTKTDNKGKAVITSAVGSQKLAVEKKYYRSNETTVLVPVLKQKNDFRVFVTATGRQVPISVVDKISGKPLENALVRAEGSEARTDKQGTAVLVLPADKTTAKSIITANNYNTARVSLVITDQVNDKNTVKLTPTGKLYFLSKLSGKIDVVKTNLDGTERQTVLAGTGNESSTETVLLASRDWRYLALQAKRDNDPAKIYVIDTSNDKLTTVDEGNATFTPVGWSGDRFIYVTYRNNVRSWEPYAQALKSYDATTGKLNIVDQTAAEGGGQYDYAYNSFSQVYILDNELVYVKNWFASYSLPNRLDGKNVSLVSAKPDASGKKTIKDFAIPAGTQYSYIVDLNAYAPDELYLRTSSGAGGTFYEYADGKLTAQSGLSDQKFYNESYATYLVSPDDTKTFWSEARDGKNVLFVGDVNGKNGKQVASLSSYTAYGWYGNNYLLVSKNGSELYIMPMGGGTPLKVTDYHKPAYDFRGYGYGYGGL